MYAYNTNGQKVPIRENLQVKTVERYSTGSLSSLQIGLIVMAVIVVLALVGMGIKKYRSGKASVGFGCGMDSSSSSEGRYGFRFY